MTIKDVLIYSLSVEALLLLALFIVSEIRGDARFRRMSDMVTESHQLLAKSIDARDAERQAWAVERQQLLDRIQAPSFGEYKQAEVRTIKAQNGVKEPPPLEQL